MDYKKFRAQMSQEDELKQRWQHLAYQLYYARAEFKKAKIVLPSDIRNRDPLTQTEIKSVINTYNNNDTYASLGKIQYLYNSTRMDGKGYTYQTVYDPESLLNLQIDRLPLEDLKMYLEDVREYEKQIDKSDDRIKKVIDKVEEKITQLSAEREESIGRRN